MLRRQIYLTEKQIITLKELAKEDGVSISEVIRYAIDNYICQRVTIVEMRDEMERLKVDFEAQRMNYPIAEECLMIKENGTVQETKGLMPKPTESNHE